ncbi:peptidoglycan recognition family protein, partial [Streptomyces sp. NPDC088090]|uniref:peptidoglycan recognition protein family protein n=1 Tax=Streptomyces sp. NPDC088090 TaxID=3365822 RepID=UPI00384C16C3
MFRVGLGGAVAAVVGTELALPGAAVAAPSPQFPWIIDCDTWGARPPSSPIQLTGNTTNKIILHHMAFPNVTDYSRAHAVQLAKDCQDLHMDTNGWIDTGNHFTISRTGIIMEGRHRSLERLLAGSNMVVGAHTVGQNTQGIGIENNGTYTSVAPPSILYASLVSLCSYICYKYGLAPTQIFGHRDFN